MPFVINEMQIVSSVDLDVLCMHASTGPKAGVPLAFQMRIKKPQTPTLAAWLGYPPITRFLTSDYTDFAGTLDILRVL
jgi:hypothetical protein